VENQTRPLILNERLAAISLVVLAGASVLVYGLLIVRPANLSALYPFPRQEIYYLYSRGAPALQRMVIAFLLLGVLYGLGYLAARRARGKGAWIAVLGGGLVFSCLMLFLQPIDAADVYDNIMHGRILGIYGENPFKRLALSYPHDPFYEYAAWKKTASAYGPAWEIPAGLTAWLAGNGIMANVLAFKILAGVFWLGCLALVAALLKQKDPANLLPGVFLLAWNPVVIYEVWGNGHNDLGMVFWVLAAILAAWRWRYSTAVLCLTMGALVKFIPVLLIPAVVIQALAEQTTLRWRAWFLIRTALGVALLVGLAYAPFWEGTAVLSIQRRMTLYSASLPASAYHVLKLWLDGKTAAQVVALLALSLTFGFVLWRSLDRRGIPALVSKIAAEAAYTSTPLLRRNLDVLFFDILAFYLLVTCLWFQAWYTLWLIGLAPVVGSGRRRRLAILFGFAALGKQLVAGPYLFWPHPSIAQPWLEIYFMLWVLGLPLLYALYAILSATSQDPRKSFS
jgi:hypothetical protein